MSDGLDIEDIDAAGARIRVLTLDRPAQRNPLDKVTMRLLRDELERADGDDAVRSVIVTGAGETFSAGGDLRGYVELYQDRVALRSFLEDFATVCALLERGRFTSLAMVNGTCVAGGLELALACDFVLADEGAMIGDGHLKFGQLPGAGGSQRLCRAVGIQHAKDLMLTGRLISGVEAAAIGLVTRAVPSGELFDRTTQIAAETARHSPLAVTRMKELIMLSQESLRAAALRDEIDLVVDYATGSHDAVEGLLAFAERRRPDWTGR